MAMPSKTRLDPVMRETASDKSYAVIYPRDDIRMRDKGMAHWCRRRR